MHIYPRNARGREVTPRLRDLTCKMESSDIAKCEGGDGVLAHPRRVEEVVDSTVSQGSRTAAGPDNDGIGCLLPNSCTTNIGIEISFGMKRPYIKICMSYNNTTQKT